MTSDPFPVVLWRDFLIWKRNLAMDGKGIRIIALGVAFITLVAFVSVVAAIKSHGG